MTKTSPDPREAISQTVLHQLWEKLPQTDQRTIVAILAACLLRQVSDRESRSLQQEVQREPTTR